MNYSEFVTKTAEAMKGKSPSYAHQIAFGAAHNAQSNYGVSFEQFCKDLKEAAK